VRWVAVGDPARASALSSLRSWIPAGSSLTPVPQGPSPIVGLSAGQPFALAGDITEPLPQTSDPNFDRDTSYFEDAVTFVLPVKVDAAARPGTPSASIVVSYQVCDSRVCLPPARVTVSVPLTIKGA
jgi:thiol:disulfide interchange protein DsbD